MILLPVINEKETKINVREYFNKEFPRLILQAGYSMSEISSSHFSLAPSYNMNISRNEDVVINGLEAQETVKATIKAIKICPGIYNKILLSVYVKGIANNDVEMLLGYSHAQYNRLKGKSFVYFADAFSSIRDFRVYK